MKTELARERPQAQIVSMERAASDVSRLEQLFLQGNLAVSKVSVRHLTTMAEFIASGGRMSLMVAIDVSDSLLSV